MLVIMFNDLEIFTVFVLLECKVKSADFLLHINVPPHRRFE